MRLYRIFMLLVLICGAAYQSYLIFLNWQQTPKKDVLAWRLEYAEIHALQAVPSEILIPSNDVPLTPQYLEIQLQADSKEEYPILARKIALPNLEVLFSNVTGEPLAYQELTPLQWLGSDPRLQAYLTQGVTAKTQITVNIPIVLPETASGFQVQMVYPNSF
jgi:hypothetical protein